MRYHLRERAWALTESFSVRDEANRPVLDVRGKFFHIGDNLMMYDHQSGQPLLQIKQRLLSLFPCYDLYRDGQHWGRVHEQFKIFGEKFKVQGDNGMVFHIAGDLWNWDFQITDGNNNHLGYVGRRLSLFRDSYAVDVAPGIDAPFIIGLALVIEMVREHHRKKEREHD
ncbi:MAG TPA: LURP-one-related family protein [Ktedonobacteraceae bacterium]|nr:LURP-one-related family protein [Ktedonobacteraceae bacterium]